MPAYVVITREKTRDTAQLDQYKQLAPTTFKEHPVVVRAMRGRHKVMEGSAIEEVVILEFPSYEEAEAWYHSEAYQSAAHYRFLGGDHRFIVTEGVPSAH